MILTDQELEEIMISNMRNNTHGFFNDARAVERAILDRLIPIYAFRRKGQPEFCTCDYERYSELSSKDLFETKIFYSIDD